MKDRTEQRPLFVAGVQAQPVAWDPDRTRERYEARVRDLCEQFPGLGLVVHPELHLSAVVPGESAPDGYAARVSETVPGPLTVWLGQLAAQLEVWLVPGSIYERDADGRIYNTAVAISPAGEMVASYRKCFPWRPYELTTPGEEFVVFDMDGFGRAGLSICYDGWFPEVSRHLAWMGADVILQPSLTSTSDRPQELILAQANAIANQVYIVNVNAAGPFATGRSIVVDPEGSVRGEAGEGEQLLTDVLDLGAVARVRKQGTLGLNRLWEQLLETDLRLPMYGGRLGESA